MTSLPQVGDDTFAGEVLEARLPVLVDFWAPWCAYCRAMAPIVEQIAADYGGRLKVVAINADAHPQSAARLAVRGLPNFVLVKNGQVQAQIVGAVPKSRLVRAIDPLL